MSIVHVRCKKTGISSTILLSLQLSVSTLSKPDFDEVKECVTS